MLNKAIMIRKASNLKDWKEVVGMYNYKLDVVKAEKIIIVSEEEYKDLCNNFFKARDYITDNIDAMWYEDNVWHCILVTTAKGNKGILIESEGHNYARYTGWANVSDFNNEEVKYG